MSEEMQSPAPATIEPATPPVMLEPAIAMPKKSPWTLILSLLSIFALVAAGYFYWQKTQLKSQSTPAPTPVVSPQSSVDPTADWQTYTNSKYGYTFRYPNDLKTRAFAGSQDDLSGAREMSLETTDSDAFASIIANDNVDGEPAELKKIESIGGYETFATSHPTGYPDDPTPFTVVELRHKNRGVQFIFYNQDKIGSKSAQILSTFRFTNTAESTSILQIIQTLTKPMVWSTALDGSLVDDQGKEISGTLMTSKVGSKEQNKLSQYLVTDTPIVTKYGWKELITADGIGQSLVIYAKDGQKLIIRLQDGQYNILLSN